ncbi:ATP-binding protein [Parabacteroides sp. AF17-28]|uniref:ATP-binding protein n=1 Tax=Parabacteroides sp. AF17-28 TaxID=2292241 RepID=UPI000F002B4F|nr:ATP-binding protein [Parabacteroides sp. AF17-28]RHR52880.1 PAS domain S-box protein [Parabacteroides sp. AF17-28]
MMSVFPDEKVLEQEYKDLSGLLSNIVSSVPMYLFVKDTGNDFRYVYASPMMEQLFGQYHGDIVGKTDFELFNDPVVAQAFRDKDLDVLKSRKTQRFVEQMIDREGVLRSIDTMKMLVPREGKDPYLLGMSWDITRQQQIEEEQQENNKRLALSCQAGKIYPWIWDVINETAELSFAKDGEIIHTFITHESFTEKIHPDEQQMYRDVVNAFARGETDSLRLSFRCHYFSDEYVWLEKIGEVYEYDKDGKPSKAIGILRDITVDKQHEEDVRAKHLAEESDRMKSAFIANMSHEIRTPLNAIVGFSTLLAQADTEEEKQEYLQIIQSSNEFLLQLIGDILDISKIESGKLEFVYTTFRLNEIFQPQERAFSLRAETGVKVCFETDGNDYYIESEKTRLTQVITNFLSNAIKFTSSGSIRFGYRITETGIYAYVTDTGTGIAKEHLSSVFDRFVKLDMFKQGTGLGLSICKTIISMLKGEIGVESEVGKGSTFWFAIPCTPIKVS